MISTLLGLPEHVQKRLITGLRSGELAAPYGVATVRRVLGHVDDPYQVVSSLESLDSDGIEARGIALAVESSAEAGAAVPRADLVWSWPELKGLHSRDTKQAFDEVVLSAKRSLLISSFVYYDGKAVFRKLSETMEAVPELEVQLLLNIQRKWGDSTESSELVTKFADRLWKKEWPGARRPEVYYDPRSIDIEGGEGVLHAKVLVADEDLVLVTSANLTDAAINRNCEAGLLVRDRGLALNVTRHFSELIRLKLLKRLPG